MDFLLTYLTVVSFLAVILTVYDKRIAGTKHRRIAEKTLFSVALAGGSLAMYLTMRIVRHKTRHKRFMLGLPAIALVQIILLWWISPLIP